MYLTSLTSHRSRTDGKYPSHQTDPYTSNVADAAI